MHTGTQFDSLFEQLANAWDAHQNLRHAQPTIPDLASSASELWQARQEMWDWHGRNNARST